MPSLFQRLSLAAGIVTGRKSMSAQAWLRGDDGGGASGAQLISPLQQSVWVYACISTLANALAQIPFKLSQTNRDDETVVDTGPLADLFARPHPLLSEHDFKTLLVTWLMLRGRCYVVATTDGNEVLSLGNRGSARQIRQLIILNADLVQPIVTRNALQGFRYSSNTQESLASQVLLPEEVIYLRLPSPFDFFGGLGPLQVAQLAAASDYAAAQFMKGLMLNNADTGLIIGTDQGLSPDQREQMLAALRNRKRSAGTADRPLILESGLKVEKPQIATADLQFLENRKFARQEICAVFGVPEQILGYTDDANRSVGQEQRANFIENTVCPLSNRIEGGLQPLCRAFGLWGWFDEDSHPAMVATRRARWDTGVKMFGLGVPIDVISDQLDLGLPPLPHDGIAYLPFSLQAVGMEPKPADGGQKTEGSQADPVSAALESIRVLKQLAAAPAPAAAASPSSVLRPPSSEPALQCAANRAWDDSIAASVKLKHGRLQRFFFEQGTRVLAKLRSALSQSAALRPPSSEARALPDDLWNADFENSTLKSRLKPTLIADLNFGGAQVFEELSLGTAFNLPPAEALRFLAQREPRITGINDTTFEQLKDTLGQGLEAGDSYEQLAARVKAVYTEASQTRAETIALTETATAVNAGRFAGMQQAGVERKGWLTSHLEHTRATHQFNEQLSDANNGLALAEAWPNGLMFPSDPAGDPGEVINCRCVGIAILGDASVAASAAPASVRCLPSSFLAYPDWLARRSPAKA